MISPQHCQLMARYNEWACDSATQFADGIAGEFAIDFSCDCRTNPARTGGNRRESAGDTISIEIRPQIGEGGTARSHGFHDFGRVCSIATRFNPEVG